MVEHGIGYFWTLSRAWKPSRISLTGSCHESYRHPITHNLSVTVIHGPAGLQRDGKCADFLHPFPDRFGTGMTVVFAPEKPAKAGDQPHSLAGSGPDAGWQAGGCGSSPDDPYTVGLDGKRAGYAPKGAGRWRHCADRVRRQRSGGCADRGPPIARPLHAAADGQRSIVHPVPGHRPVGQSPQSPPAAAYSGLFFQPGVHCVAQYAKGATEPP